jgi:hypothetical protein
METKQSSGLLFRLKQLLIILFSVTVFLSLRPYFTWYAFPYLYKIFSLSTIFISSLYFLVSNQKIKKSNYIYTFFLLSIFSLLQFSTNGIQILYSSSILLMIIFILFTENLKINIFNTFFNIYIYMLIPSLILYVLILIGIDISWDKLISINSMKANHNYMYYREYLGMVVLSTLIFPVGTGEIFRLSGVFDEPGLLGTLSTILLLIKKYNLNNWKEKILLVSGILSFSLFFYIASFIYLILKRKDYSIKFFIMVILLSIIFNKQLSENEFILKYTVDRIVNVIMNPAKVNNRTSDCFENEFNSFLISEELLLGYGQGAHSRTGCDVSLWKSVVYNYGLIGFMLILLLYAVLYFELKNKVKNYDNFIFIFIFILVFYQRPAFDTIWFFILFYSGLLISKKNYIKEINENTNHR